MSTSQTLRHLAASTAVAAVLAASAGTAGLCLATSASAAVVPGGTLRTLHAGEFQTAAGLHTPTVHSAARIPGGRGANQ
jgi:uncharacterized membrane protein (UPF0136 family)